MSSPPTSLSPFLPALPVQVVASTHPPPIRVSLLPQFRYLGLLPLLLHLSGCCPKSPLPLPPPSALLPSPPYPPIFPILGPRRNG
ncbi:hypothetical protein E2C01_013873 [Portunus trituberculatus]|uniref:Uncharacterized protein n=1 Tax=Portunus trituberculatus TaxID=210409 RepID=A0A5B7DIM7_PORTR|nr:hypothetical protein [Portunus trituberculatus]